MTELHFRNTEECINRIKSIKEMYAKDTPSEVALSDAINALEKQIPKKPIMKPYFEDMEEEYLCCPTCGEILTDRIPFENKDFYFHCLNCGQKLDWSDTD